MASLEEDKVERYSLKTTYFSWVFMSQQEFRNQIEITGDISDLVY